MIINMTTEPRKIMDDHIENLRKIENTCKYQTSHVAEEYYT